VDARLIELLNRAADAMDDGMDPFDHGFLAEHGVTLEECFTMAELLAVGARLVAFGLENPKIARGALDGAHMAAAYQALNRSLTKWQPLVAETREG
jgi:hypothetical protein